MSEAARVSLPLIVLAWTLIFAVVLFAIARQNARLRRQLVGSPREPRETWFELAWSAVAAALVVLVVLLGDRAAGTAGGDVVDSDALATAFDGDSATTAAQGADAAPAARGLERTALSR